MPEISRFYGIVVSMYYNEHRKPHFHASYGRNEVAVAVPSLAVIKGGLPPRALGLLMEWAARHRDDLVENWDRARAGSL